MNHPKGPDKVLITVRILIDLQDAFHIFHHDILLKKLYAFIFSKTLVNYF